ELLDGHLVSRRGLTAAKELAQLADGAPAVELDDQLTGGRAKKLFGAGGSGVAEVAVRAWAEGGRPESDRWTGSLAMGCEVTLGGATRSYALSAPLRGPEVFDFAAEFVAWSTLRAL